jgi:glycosyltransferase involved in cell wall biosynthesis
MNENLTLNSVVKERPLSQCPRVSVIVPTYNRERYLQEAIDSVLHQTLSALELIVIDDGSTDATPALVSAIHDQRLRYIIQPHRGLSAALNRGLESARAEYVARLDSDDVFLPDALSTLLSILETDRTVDVVWARGQFMDQEGRLQPRTCGSREHFPGEMLRSLAYEDCTTNDAMLVRKSCFTQVGPYDETLAFSEDWDMALRLARHFRFRFVDKVVVHIREHDDTMTKCKSPTRTEFLNSRTLPLDKLFNDPHLPADVVAIRPLAYANLYLFRGKMWISTRDFRKALREFARAIATSETSIKTIFAIVWRIGIVQILERSALGRWMLGRH